MRILAIRGQNIASLAARFEVLLDQGPLSGAGLFAIVGETGAGKSSILDAVCLALYGKCPRILGDGGRDDLPDTGEERIRSSDPRTVLRRGAAAGFAEVDFVGADEERYRATWIVRRARDRSTGKLQAAQQMLVRLSDGQGVADGLEQTRAAVEAKAGLTFEQFRRTVLLAQGDFDAFLRANDDQRADLLEKVTGTEIYAQISRRVFEAARDKREMAVRLADRLSLVGGLDPLARDGLQAELVEARKVLAGIRNERDRVQGQLSLARRLTESTGALEIARATELSASCEWGDAEEDRRTLQKLETAETLRPAMREEAEAIAQYGQAEANLAAAHEAQSRTEQSLSDVSEQVANALTLHEASEASFKTFGPIWTLAEQLDGRIGDANAVTQRWRADLAEKVMQLEAGRRDQGETSDRAANLTARLNQIKEVHLSTPDLTALVAIEPDIAADFSSWATARAASVKAEHAYAEHGLTLARLSETHAGLTASASAAANSAALAETVWREAQTRLEGVDEAFLETRQTALQAVVRTLDDCARYSASSASATSAHLKAVAAGETATAAQTASEAEVEALETRRQAIEGEVHSAIRFQALADDDAREAADQLRLTLAAGAPCPVCGSQDHPFATDSSAVSRLAALQKAEVERLGAEQLDLDGLIKRARASLDTHRQTVAAMGSQAVAALRESEGYQSEWFIGRGSVIEFAQQADLAIVLPDTPNAADADEITGLARTTAFETFAEAKAAIEEARRARQEVDRLIAAMRASAAEADRIREKSTEATAALTAGQITEVALRSEVDAKTREIARLRHRLEPVVNTIGYPADALERDARISDKVLEAIRQWRARDVEICEINEALAVEAAALQKLDAVVGERTGAEAQSRRSADRALGDLGNLLQERSALLGGESTGEHRTRHNQERLRAQVALDTAKAAQASANAALEGARARAIAMSAALEAALARVAHKSRAADMALENVGLSRDELNELLAVGEEARLGLRARLDQIDKALASARALVGIREREVAAASLAATEIEALDVLEISAPRINALFEEAVASEANIARRIAEDDQRSSDAAELVEQLAAAEKVRDEHAAVNAAIGSADGSRFRRIAQRITLRALVQHANAQLETLAPRYRIAQTDDENLGLWVVDQDMGSEIRSTRSLSGGERFLVSLSLALALAGLEGRGAFVQTLFIDEGFGSLDATTLDVAVDALEALQSGGRQVGVITHVRAMIDRITAQVRIEKEGGGKSRVVVAEVA